LVIGGLADGDLADGQGIQHDTLSRWRAGVRIPPVSPLPPIKVKAAVYEISFSISRKKADRNGSHLPTSRSKAGSGKLSLNIR